MSKFYLGDSGVAPFDTKLGDTITEEVNFGRDFGTDAFVTSDAMRCDGKAHLWNQPIPGDDCSATSDQCTSCTVDGIKRQCYTGKRSAVITQRRKLLTFPDGTRQYAAEAGLQTGVSCFTPGSEVHTPRWTYTDIEILV